MDKTASFRPPSKIQHLFVIGSYFSPLPFLSSIALATEDAFFLIPKGCYIIAGCVTSGKYSLPIFKPQRGDTFSFYICVICEILCLGTVISFPHRQIPLLHPLHHRLALFKLHRQPQIPRLLEIILIPSVGHEDKRRPFFPAPAAQTYSAPKNVFRHFRPAGIAQFLPRPPDRIGHGRPRGVRLPARTARGDKIIFAVMLKQAVGASIERPDKEPGYISRRPQIIIRQLARYALSALSSDA